ncbi:MAG: T9SS type A sorting domain-containing protein [candidate division WOR-3 bacterium]
MVTFIAFLIFNQWLETQIVVGKNPTSVCYNPINHKVYSLNRRGSSISIIDAATNQVIDTIFVNNPFGEIVYNSQNNKIYCLSGSSQDSIVVIDGATNQIILKILNPSSGGRLLYNPINNKIYCFNCDANDVTVFDGERDSLIKIIQYGIGDGPVKGCIAFQFNKIYCFNTWDGTVSVISSDIDSVIKVIPVASRPGGIGYNFKNKKIYVSHIYDPVVEIIDAEKDTLITTINLGASSWGSISYDTVYNNIYIPADYYVAVIDGETNVIIDRIYFSGALYETFYNPINKKIYCSYVRIHPIFQSIIGIIDTKTRQVIDTIPLNILGAFFPFCLNPRENRVYIPHAWVDASGTPRDSVISVIKDEVSIKESQSSSSFEIKYFPNPSKPDFLILPINVESVKIYDVNGKLIKKAKGQKISVKEIKTGIYFVKIFTTEKEYIKKLIKVY